MSCFNVGSIHCSLHMMKWGLILHYVMGCLAPALWPLMACYSNWLVNVGMEVSNTAKVHNTKQGNKLVFQLFKPSLLLPL